MGVSKMNLKNLRAMGFDKSEHIPFSRGYRVRCSQCEALCVNRHPTHERGCPNITYECKGCDARVERPGYCPACS